MCAGVLWFVFAALVWWTHGSSNPFDWSITTGPGVRFGVLVAFSGRPVSEHEADSPPLLTF